MSCSKKCLAIGNGIVDPNNSLALTFNMHNVKKRLPHHMAFQIKSTYHKTNIFWMVVNEGASTCVMSMSCWKAIGSPSIVPSPTLLTTFDGHSHRPYGIMPTFPICSGGKVVNIKVEVTDANLDYNLLLGRNWIYEMDAVVSTLFHVICFPHEGKIIKVDQLDYSLVDPRATLNSIVPLLGNPCLPTENLGVGIYSLLMGMFDLPPPTTRIDTISSFKDPLRKEFVQAHYFFNLGALSSSVTTLDDSKVGGI